MKNSLRVKVITVAVSAAFFAAPLFGCAGQAVSDNAAEAANAAANNAVAAAQSAADTAADAIQSAAGTAAGAVQSAAETAAQAVGSVANTVGNAVNDAVTNVDTVVAMGDQKSIDAVNLPGFAPISKGIALTSFSATTADGKTFTQEDFAGKDVTAINFWATTCPPCVAEMPELAEFQKSLPDNVAFITACLDADYAPDAMDKILKDAGYEGITLVGYEGDIATVADAIMSIPTTVFVNSDGVFVGGMVIGGGGDFAARYTDALNAILKSMDKPTI